MNAQRFEDFPEYLNAKQKLVDLQLKKLEIEKSRDETLLTQTRENSLDGKARALLSGAGDLLEKSEKDRRLQALSDDLRVLTRAIEIQRKSIGELESKLSQLICEKLRPAYAEIVQNLLKSAAELIRASEVEAKFRDDLFQAGIQFAGYLPPVNYNHLGTAKDNSSRINCMLHDSVSGGYLTEKQAKNLLN